MWFAQGAGDSVQIGIVLAWEFGVVCTRGGGTVQIGTVLAWDFCAVCTRGGTVQIGTALAWDFCAVCTRGGGYCADRDRISLGLLCGLHKGGGYCADRDHIGLGLLCGLPKGGGYCADSLMGLPLARCAAITRCAHIVHRNVLTSEKLLFYSSNTFESNVSCIRFYCWHSCVVPTGTPRTTVFGLLFDGEVVKCVCATNVI